MVVLVWWWCGMVVLVWRGGDSGGVVLWSGVVGVVIVALILPQGQHVVSHVGPGSHHPQLQPGS